MNPKAFGVVCITIMFGFAATCASGSTACVSNLLLEIETTLSTNYHRLLTATPRHQRAAVETMITGALHRSYLLSQRLSQLLVSNDAAAQLVATRLAEAALSGPVESGMVEGTLRSALFDGNVTWALHVCEAVLTSKLYRYENKVMLLGSAGGALAGYQLSPTLTQQFIRVHERAARALAGSTDPLERSLAAQVVERFALSRNPLFAARGIDLAKELRASAATEADRARFTRIIVKAEEPSRYADFLEDLLASPDDDIAWEAYYELRDLHCTNSVAMRTLEANWCARRSSISPGTNSARRLIYTP